MRRIIQSGFGLLHCSLATLALLPHVVHAEEVLQGTIVIETRILDFDPVSGMKSTQRIAVFLDKDAGRMRFADSFVTGTTYGLAAVRNEFELTDTSYDLNNGTLSFKVRGQTASGVRLMPDIDYSFSISFDGSNRRNVWKINGCHDGYPAYKIWIENAVSGENRTLYEFRHQSYRLLNLVGQCDTKVDVTDTSDD